MIKSLLLDRDLEAKKDAAAKLAASSPQLVVGRIAHSGVYDETAKYLFSQDLFERIFSSLGKEPAEMFAYALRERTGLKLACCERNNTIVGK